MNNILDQLDSGDAAGVPPGPRQWSGFQESVFAAVHDPSANLLIQAVAGSGKTTTIIEAMRYAPGSSLFMAFNKAIAEDIRRKATSGEVKTLNALGHRLMCDHRPAAMLNARKMLDVVRKIMGDTQDFKDFGYTLSRVCGLAKNCAFGIRDAAEPDQFADLIEAYAFDNPLIRLNDFQLYLC